MKYNIEPNNGKKKIVLSQEFPNGYLKIIMMI